MPIVVLNDAQTQASARISTDIGFNCFEFLARVSGTTVSVIDAAEGFEQGDKPVSHSGIPILFPFPNRIREGRFSWNGTSYELPESLVGYEGSGNAIHGFCLDRPWRVTEQTESRVTAEFQTSIDAPERLPLWPADAKICVSYSLSGNCLRADFTVTNPDSTPLPWGLGTHAYFRIPVASDSASEHCTVHAPTAKCWELDQCLPTGRIIDAPAGADLSSGPQFDGLNLDDVYTNVRSERGVVSCRIVDGKSGLQVEQRSDDSFREIVAFTPPWTSAVCLEPYTCTTDAINLQQQGVDAGLRVLEPGESWKGWIEIAVGPTTA